MAARRPEYTGGGNGVSWRSQTPYRHVTLSVGNGDVVSCWGPAQAQPAIGGAAGLNSPAYNVYMQQVNELINKGLSPDTVVVPATAFSMPNSTLKYTWRPFWELW